MTFCMKTPTLLRYVYHDGDARPVFDFIQLYIPYLQMEMTRSREWLVEFDYYEALPEEVVQRQWESFRDAEYLSSSHHGLSTMVDIPSGYVTKDVSVQRGQYLLFLSKDDPFTIIQPGELSVLSQAEFNSEYVEVVKT